MITNVTKKDSTADKVVLDTLIVCLYKQLHKLSFILVEKALLFNSLIPEDYHVWICLQGHQRYYLGSSNEL